MDTKFISYCSLSLPNQKTSPSYCRRWFVMLVMCKDTIRWIVTWGRCDQWLWCHLLRVFRSNVQFRSEARDGTGRDVPLPLIRNIIGEERYQRRKTAKEEVSSCALRQFFVPLWRVPFNVSCFLLHGVWAGNFVGKHMMKNMSKRSHQSALQEVRGWTTEHVQKVLRDVSCARI